MLADKGGKLPTSWQERFRRRAAALAPRAAVTAAARWLERHRAHRDRAVYVAEALCHNVIDDPADSKRSRFVELSRHEAFSPLAATLLRPFGEAGAALQALRRR
jgi:hypothetical protein